MPFMPEVPVIAAESLESRRLLAATYAVTLELTSATGFDPGRALGEAITFEYEQTPIVSDVLRIDDDGGVRLVDSSSATTEKLVDAIEDAADVDLDDVLPEFVLDAIDDVDLSYRYFGDEQVQIGLDGLGRTAFVDVTLDAPGASTGVIAAYTGDRAYGVSFDFTVAPNTAAPADVLTFNPIPEHVGFADGTLYVSGTDAGDAIGVGERDGVIRVTVGAQTAKARADGVTRINIAGRGGDDVIGLYGNVPGADIGGGEGDDFIFAGVGDDSVEGGAGDDSLSGWAGDDRLVGDAGDDWLFGHEGADHLAGGDGRDFLFGLEGDDTLDGGHRDDVLLGGAGDDLLFGKRGRDELYGGGGDDEFHGGPGRDYFVGGPGTDTAHHDGVDDAPTDSAYWVGIENPLFA